MMKDYKKLCRDIEAVVAATALFIRRESGVFDIRHAESKGFNELVSYVDKRSEQMLVEDLARILPNAGFITEEGTSSKKGIRHRWIIDPLDGTTNFVHGLHPHSISVGLQEDDEIVAGVVYEVSGNEVFTAWKGGGSYLNGSPIHVSCTEELCDSLVATGFPYSDFSRLDNYMASLAHFCKTSHGVRRLGSAAIDLAYVACGRFEAFYEYGLHPWDVAAGTIIVKEAGGRISDFSGNEKNFSGNEIVATNSNVFDEFLKIVSNFMQVK